MVCPHQGQGLVPQGDVFPGQGGSVGLLTLRVQGEGGPLIPHVRVTPDGGLAAHVGLPGGQQVADRPQQGRLHPHRGGQQSEQSLHTGGSRRLGDRPQPQLPPHPRTFQATRQAAGAIPDQGMEIVPQGLPPVALGTGHQRQGTQPRLLEPAPEGHPGSGPAIEQAEIAQHQHRRTGLRQAIGPLRGCRIIPPEATGPVRSLLEADHLQTGAPAQVVQLLHQPKEVGPEGIEPQVHVQDQLGLHAPAGPRQPRQVAKAAAPGQAVHQPGHIQPMTERLGAEGRAQKRPEPTPKGQGRQ